MIAIRKVPVVLTVVLFAVGHAEAQAPWTVAITSRPPTLMIGAHGD